ncbi:MAG TPA: FAD-dependent oxidoreductase, partial [Dissulfurispiraceae bacterium]|nr:FAD-dependent oxidoreductase [Dissulfurispiraceae bacterium]
MKIGVYLCDCSGSLSDRLDFEHMVDILMRESDVAYVKRVSLPCGQEGFEELAADLRRELPDRVVFGACSPRDREDTFRDILEAAGMNPFLFQLANIREHVAWVTPARSSATQKALRALRGAVARVKLQEPIERVSVPICSDVMVIGAGPAGLSAAVTLAESGRKVILVEKSPAPGGLPMMFDEIFPDMECGPCLMQAFLDRILHGEHAANIELLTMSHLESLRGSFGRFVVNIEQQPRYVDGALCIGCGECVTACPATAKSLFNADPAMRKAIDFASPGALPHVPSIDACSCL